MRSRNLVLSAAMLIVANGAGAADRPSELNMQKGSMLDQQQILSLRKIVLDWETNVRKKNGKSASTAGLLEKESGGLIGQINWFLSERNKTVDDQKKIAPIDLARSESVRIGITRTEGHKESFHGVNVTDGDRKFCLPCVSGYDDTLVWGVTSKKKASPPVVGAYSGILKCFEGLDSPLGPSKKNQINSADLLASRRFVPIVGSDSGRTGFHIVTDKTVYFYPAAMPDGSNGANAHFRVYKITLPDGKNTHIVVRKDFQYNRFYAAEMINKAPDIVSEDLGTGLGEKVSEKVLSAIRAEVLSQIKRTVEPEKGVDGSVKAKPSAEAACPALEACGADPVLGTPSVLAELGEFSSKLGCAGPAEVQSASPSGSRGARSAASSL